MSANDAFDAIRKVCERPTTLVRFRFDDGEWERASGPEFLERLGANSSGHVSIESVVDTAPASNGENPS